MFTAATPRVRADDQHRAADRVGVMRVVLLGVDLAGAVYLQDGLGAAWLLDRTRHFIDAVFDEGRWKAATA